MNNISLTNIGMWPLSLVEQKETEGGVIWFALAGAALLLSTCTSNTQSGKNNVQVSVSCSNCSVTTQINGDTITTKVIK